MDAPDPQPPTSPGESGVYALSIAALLVVYPLSLGPAVLMYDHLPREGQRVLRAVYEPLEMLRDTALRGPIDRYLDMWRH